MSDLPDTDFTQRFLFDDRDVRGEMVALKRSYAEVLAKHAYPRPVKHLLGELMAAAALLVGTLKFDGLLVLQAQSQGPVPLLAIEYTSEHDIRGLARFEAEQIKEDARLADLMPGGHLVLTIIPVNGQRYQGTVELDGQNLSECFTNYFVMSQQVNTCISLTADGVRARGLLVQQLPAEIHKDIEEREESWAHVKALANTVKAEELLGLDNETVLHRLYHEDAVRLFDIQPLRFRCSCSRERSSNALVSLGEQDAKALVEECGGQVEIDCQFCNERYLFDASDVAQLFAGGGTDVPSETQH
ncbi:Hsp33 family molecular chaperone HslO [Pseudomonas sp. MWU13-3659]|uniref:Hsp33 family molecular chaperone HslO n=1 Tax=Pseudomonas sp. MWU13-3659 TaxID=2986964 RepID=UPI00207639D7|nr:Hsp33 family molecular chaperone HslO [Pseudomonas sp. MWU13-3659]